MSTFNRIITEAINEAVNNIVFQMMEKSARRLNDLALSIEKCFSQTTAVDITNFLSQLQGFMYLLSQKLTQCAKDKNLNEANNGMVSIPQANPWQSVRYGFEKWYKKTPNLFDLNTDPRAQATREYINKGQSLTLNDLLYKQFPKLQKQYQLTDKTYNGVLSQMNYPRRVLDEVQYVKGTIEQYR